MSNNNLKLTYLPPADFKEGECLKVEGVDFEKRYYSNAEFSWDLNFQSFKKDLAFDTLFLPDSNRNFPGFGPAFILSKEGKLIFWALDVTEVCYTFDIKDTGFEDLTEDILSAIDIYKRNGMINYYRWLTRNSEKKIFKLIDIEQLTQVKYIRSAFPRESIWVELSNELSEEQKKLAKKTLKKFGLTSHGIPKGIAFEIKEPDIF